MKHLWIAGVPAALLAVACTTNDWPEPPEGQALFMENCASCHGLDATGSIGPDLTGLAAANGGVFPTARVLSQIDGYGRGSLPAEAMPEFGSLLEGDTIPLEVDGVLTPTPRALVALQVYLESVQQ